MIGYIFLGIALLAGTTKGYCGKKISDKIATIADSALVNTGRMLCCMIIGVLFTVIQDGLGALSVSTSTLLLSLIGGICSALLLISWICSVQQSAYMMVEVFLLLGTVIPISFSALVFNESIRFIQGIGIVILLVAVYIMSTYNTSIKGKMSIKSMTPLIIAGVANGLVDLSQKMFTRYKGADTASAFNFYTYVFAGIVLFGFYIFLRAKNKSAQEKLIDVTLFRKFFIYVLIMSICHFANSYFKTLASGYISATQLYPLNQGASVVLSLLMVSIFFKEKINKKCILGICLAFVAILFINFF